MAHGEVLDLLEFPTHGPINKERRLFGFFRWAQNAVTNQRSLEMAEDYPGRSFGSWFHPNFITGRGTQPWSFGGNLVDNKVLYNRLIIDTLLFMEDFRRLPPDMYGQGCGK